MFAARPNRPSLSILSAESRDAERVLDQTVLVSCDTDRTVELMNSLWPEG
jgi:hypothetical protein